MVLSLFVVHRLITLKPEFDFSTITAPFRGSLMGLALDIRELDLAARAFGSKYKIKLMEERDLVYHRSLASGPNGSVSIRQ